MRGTEIDAELTDGVRHEAAPQGLGREIEVMLPAAHEEQHMTGQEQLDPQPAEAVEARAIGRQIRVGVIQQPQDAVHEDDIAGEQRAASGQVDEVAQRAAGVPGHFERGDAERADLDRDAVLQGVSTGQGISPGRRPASTIGCSVAAAATRAFSRVRSAAAPAA